MAHENKYNFTGLEFQTSLSDVKTFEKNNIFILCHYFKLVQMCTDIKR